MPAGNSPNPGQEGASSGDGSDAPFGDGMGATQKAGDATGAHDFVQDPNSHAPAAGGRDFTKESKPQQMGQPTEINPDDMAPGGRLPFPQLDSVAQARKDANVDVAATAAHKPFKV